MMQIIQKITEMELDDEQFLFYSTILKHLQVPFSNDVVKNIEGAVKVSNFITILPYSNIDVFFLNVFQGSLY